MEFIDNRQAFYTNIFLILALTFAGYHYQRNQILRQNKMLSDLSGSMAYSESQKRMLNIEKFDRAIAKNNSYFGQQIF